MLVVLRVEEGAIALTAIMHGGHLIVVAPGLTCELLATRGAATPVEVTTLQLLGQPAVHEQLLDVHAAWNHREWG